MQPIARPASAICSTPKRCAGRRHDANSNMTRQIGASEIDMLVQEGGTDAEDQERSEEICHAHPFRDARLNPGPPS